MARADARLLFVWPTIQLGPQRVEIEREALVTGDRVRALRRGERVDETAIRAEREHFELSLSRELRAQDAIEAEGARSIDAEVVHGEAGFTAIDGDALHADRALGFDRASIEVRDVERHALEPRAFDGDAHGWVDRQSGDAKELQLFEAREQLALTRGRQCAAHLLERATQGVGEGQQAHLGGVAPQGDQQRGLARGEVDRR